MDANIIKEVQDCGLQVYMRDPADTYMLFTDGTRIGYMQMDRLEGLTLTTVHKANRTSGTGYGMGRISIITREALEAAFVHSPAWAGRESFESVRKYPNMEAFLAHDTWNGSYKLVA